jgi:hypothetical protein
LSERGASGDRTEVFEMAVSLNLFFDEEELAGFDADAEVYVAAAMLDRVRPGCSRGRT